MQGKEEKEDKDKEDKDDKVLVWPDLVYTELICLIAATALLTIWAIVAKAPLEQPANPASSGIGNSVYCHEPVQ